MKVKVGDKIFDGDNEPLMVILPEDEKKQIANMGTSKKYCTYPSTNHWVKNDFENIKKWMAK